MITHDRDKIIAAAKDAGMFSSIPLPQWLPTERFYATAFEAGRQAERDDLSTIFGEMHTWLTNIAVVATICARSTK